jgi:hypothetical protein
MYSQTKEIQKIILSKEKKKSKRKDSVQSSKDEVKTNDFPYFVLSKNEIQSLFLFSFCLISTNKQKIHNV